MTVEYRGGSDMTLHRLDRDEILREFEWIRQRIGKYKSSEVVILNRFGKKSHVIRVKEDINGVFLYPIEEDFGNLIALAPFLGSDMRIMDFDGVFDELKKGVSNDVWLQWPSDDPRIVVGKILAVKAGDVLTVTLTPVPKDIEEVNREVHRRVAEKCELAKSGTECGACPMLGGCKIIEEVDGEITKENE